MSRRIRCVTATARCRWKPGSTCGRFSMRWAMSSPTPQRCIRSSLTARTKRRGRSSTACSHRCSYRGGCDMELSSICERYRARFSARHGKHTTAAQWSALNALLGCHTEQYGTLELAFQECSQQMLRFRSCGHRFCNQCQQHSTHSWLTRQLQKLLPVDYYLVTFTLPFELRALPTAHSTTVLPLLMQCAAATIRRFGRNEPGLEAELGMCAVLHTHTRRLDYHPHVHLVVPGGGVNVQRTEWRTLKGKY